MKLQEASLQYEASLRALHLLKNQATLILADTTRLNHSERIPRDYYTRLQEGISHYEASMRALIAVSNEEQTATYTTKLTNQRAELDILTERLKVAAGVDTEDMIENSSRINENKKESSLTCK